MSRLCHAPLPSNPAHQCLHLSAHRILLTPCPQEHLWIPFQEVKAYIRLTFIHWFYKMHQVNLQIPHLTFVATRLASHHFPPVIRSSLPFEHIITSPHIHLIFSLQA